MTPTQRRYLEHAVRCQGGELRWTVRTSGEGTIHRMVKHLVAAGLVAFDAKRMAWVVTRAGRAAVNEGPPACHADREHLESDHDRIFWPLGLRIVCD